MNDKSEFDAFYSKILELKKNTVLKVTGVGCKAVFMASYTTKHYPDDEYLKLFFTDDTLLEIMPGQKEVFFCDDKRRNLDKNLVKDDGKYLDIDVVIAECSKPSTGMGIELGWFFDDGKPIFCFYKKGTKPSNALEAIAKEIIEYSDSEDFVKKVREIIS